MIIKVVSYNIHKGLSTTGLGQELESIKKLFEELQPDIIMLQEVVGEHSSNKYQVRSSPTQSQFEFLADEFWPHYAYGQNALYNKGHHGNCILSKFPIVTWENIDISTNRLEQRGLLRATVEIPSLNKELELLSTHLNLLNRSRLQQAYKITNYINENINSDNPLILCGDFNDWQSKVTSIFNYELGLKELFKEVDGDHKKSFPSFYPLLKLDRIYYKNLTPKIGKVDHSALKTRASDHLPLLGVFEL